MKSRPYRYALLMLAGQAWVVGFACYAMLYWWGKPEETQAVVICVTFFCLLCVCLWVMGYALRRDLDVTGR